jgi:hypothetical protein
VPSFEEPSVTTSLNSHPLSRRQIFASLAVVLILAAAWPVPVQAQMEFSRLLGGELGKLTPRFSYQISGSPDADVKGQATDFRLIQHQVSVSTPLYQTGRDEWAVLGSLRVQDIRTTAVLPLSGIPLPDDLYDISVGTQYRHRLDNDWIAGGLITFGSASDKPFASWDEMTAQATAFVRIPHGEHGAWVGLLNYSSNREFLPNIPIPGLGYAYEPSTAFRMLLGIPFASVEARPIPDLTLTANWLPIRTVSARAAYRIFGPLQVYGSFEWRNERYLREGRADDDQRLFYYEKRIGGGIQWNIVGPVTLDVSGGYAFDRMYFEAEKYKDRDTNRIDIQDGPYLSAQLLFRF